MQKKYISLGNLCQVAHQINRFTKIEWHYFFDSLVVDDYSYKSILQDIDLFFNIKNIKLINSETIIDLSTSLKFIHEFSLVENIKDFEGRNVIDTGRIEEHLSTAKQKFTHLKEKTLKAISDNSYDVFLIRKEDIRNQSDALKKINDIEATFKNINPTIKIVLLSNYCENEIVEKNYYYLNVKKSENWEGDDGSWNRVFEIINN